MVILCKVREGLRGVGKYTPDYIMGRRGILGCGMVRGKRPCRGKVFMKKHFIAKMVLTAGLSAACVMGMAACSGEDAQEQTGLTGGVAATVNGVEILEDDITLAVESVRTNYGITDEAAWADWMHTYGYTPESVRSEVIDGYVEQELVRQGAEAAGIVIESAEIDSYVDSMKSQFEGEEEWLAALSGAGFADEADYRETIETSLVVERFEETFTAEGEPAEEDLLMYAQMYATSFDGAKKSSHILFDAADEALAQEVLDKINSGELEFADAAAEYSMDGSAADGGNVGWDALTTFVTEYQTGLDELELGEVSGLVTSQFGIHIIKCTEVYAAPEELTSLDGFPQEFYDMVYGMLYEQMCADEYQAWLDGQLESGDVVVNDMPEGLSYYVDMEAYEAQLAEAEGAEGESSEGESADVVEGDAAGAAAEDEGAEVESGAGTEGEPADANTAEQPAAE